jgi:hypothetical protein
MGYGVGLDAPVAPLEPVAPVAPLGSAASVGPVGPAAGPFLDEGYEASLPGARSLGTMPQGSTSFARK